VKKHVLLGSRGSVLALKQSNFVKELIEQQWPDVEVEIRIIKTTGDKITDVPLAKIGGKGLFVKEIEDALLRGEIDLAVHSMKDVPSQLPDGLVIGAVPKREDPRDVMVAVDWKRISDLPLGGVVGTSSLRRTAQILHIRPDLKVKTLRGNLDTRLKKLRDGMYDAVILAAAGLIRMGWNDVITEFLEPEYFLPAVAQGALGIEIREDDERMRELLAPIHNETSAAEVEAERSFLAELEGGCQVPIGGHCVVKDGHARIFGMIASVDGQVLIRDEMAGPASDVEKLGRELARKLLNAGGREILEEIYSSG